MRKIEAIIKGINDFLLAALNVAPNLIIVIVGMAILYSVFQWWRQRNKNQEDERKHRERIEYIEEQKVIEQKTFNEYIIRANDRQDKTLEGLDKALTMLNMTFEKVSDKLSGHDERSNAIYSYLTSMRSEYARDDTLKQTNAGIKNLQKAMIHKEDIDRIETKIDEISQKIK